MSGNHVDYHNQHSATTKPVTNKAGFGTNQQGAISDSTELMAYGKCQGERFIE